MKQLHRETMNSRDGKIAEIDTLVHACTKHIRRIISVSLCVVIAISCAPTGDAADNEHCSIDGVACSDPITDKEARFAAEGPGVFFSKLLDTSDFPPRWNCGTWATDVGWLHVISDCAIFAAYMAIPVVLLFYLRRRKDVAVCPDGRRVVSGGHDGTLKLWDLESGELLTSLEGHEGWVNGVAVCPNGRRAASVSNDNTLKIWDLKTRIVVAEFSADTAILGCDWKKSKIVAGDAAGKFHILCLENCYDQQLVDS